MVVTPVQAITIRDADDNMQWNEEQGLLTYRARKIYHFVPELSAEGYKDADQIYVTGFRKPNPRAAVFTIAPQGPYSETCSNLRSG
jgi:hypothetical protein